MICNYGSNHQAKPPAAAVVATVPTACQIVCDATGASSAAGGGGAGISSVCVLLSQKVGDSIWIKRSMYDG